MSNKEAVTEEAKPKRRPWLWWLVGLIAVGGVVTYSLGVRPLPLTVNAQAPDFTLQDLDGNDVSLSDLKGKPVILNFWATWCKPCVEELPALENLWQAYDEGDVVILAVNQGESAKAIQDFLSDHPVSFPVLVDKSQKVNRLYRVWGLPSSYFIGADGKVEHRLQGFTQMEGVPKDEFLLEYYADTDKVYWR